MRDGMMARPGQCSVPPLILPFLPLYLYSSNSPNSPTSPIPPHLLQSLSPVVEGLVPSKLLSCQGPLNFGREGSVLSSNVPVSQSPGDPQPHVLLLWGK